MSLLLLYASLSIFFSFLCSVLEAVLLSITPTFINIKKQEGRKFALVLEKLKEDVDKPLIAILTLNTIAHTVGAILVGIEADKLPYEINFLGINFVGVISAIMTLLILVVSEIIPKTIGATYWKQLASFTSRSLILLIFPLKWTGVLWLLQLTTKLIGGKGAHGSILSREDFHAMTDIAHKEGVFEKNESAIIKNLLTFKEVLAKDIMTPRTVMITASENDTIKSFFEKYPKLRFSRIPIYSKNADNITGFVLKGEVLEEIINGNGNEKLVNLKREILVTNRNLPIPDLFERFIAEREHIALVVDEYGSTSGLVTMEDVIETLLGMEIMDESDTIADLQYLARKNWETRAKKIGLIYEKKNEEEENG
ncbi:CBS domain containing-hemolysin-like protein [Lutibacter oceani]|uniref:CBS domain containing-hemolysin-like protein n=1 Tax=Lutibacter oceani TaxID=1853311 RepID=A0A3D9RU13_9FLAO|nr:hemolysin family protein [Lutibacter oceani]REE83463.1 CBS domain containing-hemolysin-like protein [Lutibacter oceani]